MKKLLLLCLILISGASFAQVDVTFKVDMRGHNLPFTTANVNGTFNSWCGACNPLTDANNDSIWEATLSLPPGTIEFKFTADGWTAQENLTSGSPCTITTGDFTNRVLTFTAATVLPVNCWGKCGECGVLPPLRQQISLPITWEDSTTVDLTTTDFGGTFSSLSPNPVDPTKVVLSILKGNPSEVWAGTTLGTTAGFAANIPFSANSNQMQALVYSPDAGAVFLLKVEDKTDGAKSVETRATTTSANAWEVLTFNFTNNEPNTPAINYANNYNKLSIFPNFGVAGAAAGPKTYFVGKVAFGNLTSNKDLLATSEFAIYPNPSHGSVSMIAPSFAGSRVVISISDMAGKVVYSDNASFEGASKSIDIENIKPGIYLVSAKNSNGKLSVNKLIVE